MSSLKMAERQVLEQHFGMSGGYVLNFTDRTFGEFVFEAVERDIHNEKYRASGTSKANKLRTFWKLETDQLAGKLILALLEYDATINPRQDASAKARAEKCRQVAARLLGIDSSKGAAKSAATPGQPAEEAKPCVTREMIASLRDRFLKISTLPPHDRGYALEKFLYELFEAYRFNPRPSFRVVGEQIDGSIEFAHEVYLIEAKWQAEPIVQGDLAVLDSRVSGHSQIGRGIFITVGCFSPDGITAHERLRPSAMVGIDGQDLYFVLEHALPLDEVLRRKVRWLVETGRFHHPVREFITELEKHR
jgi:hypothetical protein